MNVLGLDLASLTGYSVIGKKAVLKAHGKIDTRKLDTHAERFDCLYRELTSLVKKHRVKVIAMEQLHKGVNLRTTKLLSGFLATALLVGMHQNLKIITVHQSTAKKDVVKPYLGIAQLKKEHVFQWATEVYELDFDFDKDNDVTDSILIARWAFESLTQ